MATIRLHKSGKWQAIVRRKGHLPCCRSFLNKMDAERWARHIESEIDRGIFVNRTEAERTTIGELIDRYLSEVTPLKRSFRSEGVRLRLLKQRFGAIAAASLRAKDVSAYRDQRLALGAAGATVVKDLNSLSHVLDVAIKDWSLPLAANPVKLVRKPKQATGRDRRLSPDEESKLLEACKRSRSPMLVSIVILALETGMRLGELLLLEWDRIRFDRKIAYLPITKNGDPRTVPLSSKALEALGSIPRKLNNQRVFWTWSRPDSFENAWKRALLNAAILNFSISRPSA